jgi:transcriptional regulator with XRE-family HTH domain
MPVPNVQLKRERQIRGWSQGYLAEQIDVPDYYISRWERGDVSPSPYYQQRLCELFGKTAEELGFLQPVHETPHSKVLEIDEKGPLAKVNPFTYGNPISVPTRFFGRSREVEQVFSRLRNAEFESSSIVGERRIGKTSLLKYLAHPVVRQHYGLDEDKYLFVYMDLQNIDENTTPARLWQWLLRQTAKCCSDPQAKQMLEAAYQNQHIDNFAIEDIFDNIDKKDMYVVLLFDEFERVTKNPNFNAAFFYGIRSLAIHHHLSLITSSRSELIELCHSEIIRSSPFFNIFATINMGLFRKDEALDLTTQSLAGTGINFTDTEIDAIFRLTGYHPYLLQIACYFLFDAYLKNMKPDERTDYQHKAFREEVRPHLASCWQISDDHEKTNLIALTVLDRQREANRSDRSIQKLQDVYVYSHQTLARLEKRGLAVSRGGSYFLFSESFGEWIWNEITDTRHNQHSYEAWLASNAKVTQQLNSVSDTARKDLSAILSKLNEEYRELVFHWLIEQRTLSVASKLIKGILESDRGLLA